MPGTTVRADQPEEARIRHLQTVQFSDDAWAALDALGENIDADLMAQDVRLTMGGEPTFVSIDDYQSAEWNTDALGPEKRIRADELIRRLRRRLWIWATMYASTCTIFPCARGLRR